MSLSKQERCSEDRLSDLDFIGGHLKIGIAKGRPHPRIDAKIGEWKSNVKSFFTSRIGKPAEMKEMEKAFSVPEEEPQPEQPEVLIGADSIDFTLLPDTVRELVVHKMPLQSRLNLAATSKRERELVKKAKVECKLFVIDDVDRRTSNLLRYPDLHWMVFTRPGKRYFLNFLCDWGQEIAICFCEERRPFQGINLATKVYWLTPSAKIKKTVIPNVNAYDMAVQTAAHFFSVISGETRRCSISMPGWPSEIFSIPELRNAYVIGSSYDDVESIHKTYDFFEPFSFDVHMHQTARRYTWPLSFLQVARHGLHEWVNMKAKDRALCDAMLDKDLRILILHDSFVSQTKMHDFIKKWQCGGVDEKFMWWAISTHMPVDVNVILDGIGHLVLEEKCGPRLIAHYKHEKAPKQRGTTVAVTYQVDSRLGAKRKGTLVVRDNMVLFANTNCAPDIDASGLVTFKSRSGISETQF